MKILRELREKRGLTLEQVAEGVGLRNQYISNYELGKRRPDYDTICKLADFFGVSVDYLLGREKKEKPSSKEAGGREEEFMRLFRALPPEAQERELAYLRERAAGKGK